MGIWIRRGVRAAALGLATAWLVAWGVAIAAWAGWVDTASRPRGLGIAVVDPWLVELKVFHGPGTTSESWRCTRIDRDTPLGARERERAERVRAIGGAAYDRLMRIATTTETSPYLAAHAAAFAAELDGEDPKVVRQRLEKAKARIAAMRPPARLDDQIEEATSPTMRGLLDRTRADALLLSVYHYGWPLSSVRRCEWTELTWGTQPTRTPQSSGAIELHKLVRAPHPNWAAVPLSLPYLPIWSGLATNTAVFAAAWFAVFTALAALQAARRTLAGRCPRCAYDLRRVTGNNCPECGRAKRN